MSEARLTASGPGSWQLAGVLDFTTVMPLVTAAERLLARRAAGSEPRLEVDLAGVESTNSAGLALLLEWVEMAQARGLDILYLHPPRSLQRIAAFSNLQTLLPVGA